MKTLKCAAVAVLLGISLGWSTLRAEPLMTIFQFSEPNYADTLTTNAIVVTITRADQDPDATDTQNFTVDCKFTGGTGHRERGLSFQLQMARVGSVEGGLPTRGQGEFVHHLYHQEAGSQQDVALSADRP